MDNKCTFCKEGELKQGEGDYREYLKCSSTECGMYQLNKGTAKSNIILPDDPFDALMCESCQ